MAGRRAGRSMTTTWRLAGALMLGAGTLAGAGPTAVAAGAGYDLVEAWPGVKFKAPIAVAAPRDASDRMFVVQRGGQILLTKKNRGGTPVPPPRVFLDTGGLERFSAACCLGPSFRRCERVRSRRHDHHHR